MTKHYFFQEINLALLLANSVTPKRYTRRHISHAVALSH